VKGSSSNSRRGEKIERIRIERERGRDISVQLGQQPPDVNLVKRVDRQGGGREKGAEIGALDRLLLI